MIKINLKSLKYTKNSAEELKDNLSKVKHPEKVMQALTRRVLRQYQKSINTKIDFN